MFETTLIKGAKENLALLGKSDIDRCLSGRRYAAALQLGHRISVDFDFFTPKKFVPRSFTVALSKAGPFKEDQPTKEPFWEDSRSNSVFSIMNIR